MLIVPLPGPDCRLVGRSAQARNLLVAARVGAATTGPDALASSTADLAMLVPSTVALHALLFADPAFTALATRLRDATNSSPVWIDGTASVLVGRPAALVPYTANLAAAAALPRVGVDRDGLLDLSTAAARRHAAWRILQRTAKKTDGWVSRNFNRPISRPISYVLLALGLNAGHASLLTLAFGFAAAAVGAIPGYLPCAITGIMFQFASVLDGVDGEMARATLTESEAGARLDTIVDQLTYLACFIGVTTGWVRETGGTTPLLWTVGLTLGLVLSLVRAGLFVRRHAENASFVFIDRTIRRAARETGLSTLRYAAAVFTLLRRDLFSMIFLVVALTGQRVLVPGLIAFGIVVANLTFSGHRRELAAAARNERLSAA